MLNDRLRADMATMLDGLGEQFRGIAELQKERALLTATATACDKRIEVTVNADGLLIATKFADDVLELSLEEIATNLTAAVQSAAADVAARGKDLMTPLLERRDALPKLSEIIEGAPDLGAMLPTAPAPPTVPPEPAWWPTDGSGTRGPRSAVADNDD
ncbi:YbaB/EbfC family nucleoid-associated protein [Nocardia sp. FBN12]|uniref:YbaB/EbfC family nucleoid-associated protein n=1 Tax=Nocardia sp. FBN12 TaxID=3419766 RepID=UPI003D04824B